MTNKVVSMKTRDQMAQDIRDAAEALTQAIRRAGEHDMFVFMGIERKVNEPPTGVTIHSISRIEEY